MTPPIRGGIYEKRQDDEVQPTPIAASVDSSTRPNVTARDINGDADAYTDWAEKQETDTDSLRFPSLDPAVQQDIAQKYRYSYAAVL
ncbi:hypothetical protein N657DRAFT_646752 [Parathielavia appendiculata]|uniref:Uncharacterized protein n=1 Tax=Parathielavia appendiculata TaxID=2587402 RepID=A0AAN6TWI1_9PEZI|nr:hypothetical protein N657DRAFT_646752 [Parathielavia appendiculata]